MEGPNVGPALGRGPVTIGRHREVEVVARTAALAVADHLVGQTIVFGPLLEEGRVLVERSTVEVETHMVCDVVPNEDTAWGELKSRYR